MLGADLLGGILRVVAGAWVLGADLLAGWYLAGGSRSLGVGR